MGNFPFKYRKFISANNNGGIPNSYIKEGIDLNSISNINKLLKIDEGNYSNVYMLNERIVLKISKKNCCNYLDNITELTILSTINHPNIIKGCGFLNVDNKLCFLLDRCETSLDKFIFTDNDMKEKIITDMINGLSYLHSQMYLHLDLKPANILIKTINNIPSAYIADFSLACKTKNLSVISSFERISEYYRPYENLKGALLYSDKSDIWSLGIIIYEIRTGITMSSRIGYVTVEDSIDVKISLSLFYDREIIWKRWPPSGYHMLDSNPECRYLKNETIIEAIKPISSHFSSPLDRYFPVFITNSYLQETHSLFEKINGLVSTEVALNLDPDINNWYVACFVIIYSNYNLPSDLIPYFNIFNLRQIYIILCYTGCNI